MFWRKKKNRRSDHLFSAGKAKAKGNKYKAIVLYQKMLQDTPDDYEVHRKLAPLLAETKKYDASWESFKKVGQHYEQIKHPDKAISMYSQAARYIPKECETWEMLSAAQLKKGLKAEALNTLLKGKDNFKGRKHQYKAIRLLQKAWKLEPWNFQLSVELAPLLVRVKAKDQALKLLEGLAERQDEKKNLKRVRGMLLRMSPTPATFWHWLRASLLGR